MFNFIFFVVFSLKQQLTGCYTKLILKLRFLLSRKDYEEES